MFIKWIVCRVPAQHRQDFSVAQTAWASIAGLPGFRGQLGGWEETAVARTGSEEAGILGVWADHASYRRFMGAEHDAVTVANRQDVTYDAIAVDEMEVVQEFPGTAPSLPEAIEGWAAITLMRVAECTVRQGREGHFQEVQREIWTPGMNRTGAVLATIMARSTVRPERFVVVSLWSDAAAHRTYVANDLPGLRERSGVVDDLDDLAGHIVALEPAWTITPAPTERTP